MELPILLQQIEENRQQIDAAGTFSAEVLNKIQYKFRLDWNYYSNKMEGGTLTRQETRSVMVGNVTVGGKPIKDVMEMKGHDNVVLDILKIGKGELRISEKRIKAIHKAIMHEDDPEQAKLIGEWKKSPNEVINYKGEKIPFASPAEVPDKMHTLLDTTNARLDKYFAGARERLHPLIIASDFHLDYVTIHPFYDGNGRTTRILSNLILISCGYPPIIIKESEKTAYYQYLADIQVYGGNRELFYEFMAGKLAESQKLVLDAIEGKDIEEADDVNKEIELLRKELADKVYSKSPQTIYNAFQNTDYNVWPKVLETLKKFDEFFSDNNTKCFLNNRKEMTAFSFVHDFQIFGYDIRSTDIDSLRWKHEKLGLKGARKESDISIILQMEFNKINYTLSLHLNNASVFSKTYNYATYAGPDDVDGLKNALAKAMINVIRENTKG